MAMANTASNIFMQKIRLLDYMLRRVRDAMEELGAQYRVAKGQRNSRHSTQRESGILPDELQGLQVNFDKVLNCIRSFDGKSKPAPRNHSPKKFEQSSSDFKNEQDPQSGFQATDPDLEKGHIFNYQESPRTNKPGYLSPKNINYFDKSEVVQDMLLPPKVLNHS